MHAWILVGGGAALLALWWWLTYNRFVRLRNGLKEAWSGIDVQLKRRHDLVPNLIETVRGYRDHERGLFEELAARRTAATQAQGLDNVAGAENGLTRGLRQIFAIAEAYPELKADSNFRQLSDSLVEIEDQLQYARRYYNGTARDLNNLAESFPSLLVAKSAGIQPAAFFEIESALERTTPEVKL